MKFLTLLFAILSFSTFAADRNDAYNLICKPMSFESERNRCIAIIKPHSYFNDDALVMCTQFNFNSTKMECLGYIAGKTYEFFEIDTCRNATFDSEKLNCLRLSGTPSRQTCLPKTEVLSQLRAAQLELSQGNVGTVAKRLDYLIGRFSNPNCQ